jgi:hypothetical protein
MWDLGCLTSVCRSEMGLGTLILMPRRMAGLCERRQSVDSLTAGCHLGEGEPRTEMLALQGRPSSARSETVVVVQAHPSQIHAYLVC